MIKNLFCLKIGRCKDAHIKECTFLYFFFTYLFYSCINTTTNSVLNKKVEYKIKVYLADWLFYALNRHRVDGDVASLVAAEFNLNKFYSFYSM